MFIVVVEGHDIMAEFATRSAALAAAREFTEKYGETTKVYRELSTFLREVGREIGNEHHSKARSVR